MDGDISGCELLLLGAVGKEGKKKGRHTLNLGFSCFSLWDTVPHVMSYLPQPEEK